MAAGPVFRAVTDLSEISTRRGSGFSNFSVVATRMTASPSALNHCVVICDVIDQSDHCDSWGGIDRAAGVFIVETDIAAHDGCVESAASFGQAFDRFAELPEISGLYGFPKFRLSVTASRTLHRNRSGCGPLRRPQFFRLSRIERTVERIAVGRRGQNLFSVCGHGKQLRRNPAERRCRSGPYDRTGDKPSSSKRWSDRARAGEDASTGSAVVRNRRR